MMKVVFGSRMVYAILLPYTAEQCDLKLQQVAGKNNVVLRRLTLFYIFNQNSSDYMLSCNSITLFVMGARK